MSPRSISVLSVQAPTELDTKCFYQLDAADHLLSDFIPLTVDRKIDHKYLKFLKMALHNTEHKTVHIPRKTVIRNLQPIEVEEFQVSKISWTITGTGDTTNSPMELPHVPLNQAFSQSTTIQSIQ